MRFIAGLVLGGLIVATSTAPSVAQERTLGRPGVEEVLIWKDSAANSEALRLIRAGVHNRDPGLVTRLLSCVAKHGDKAVVLDGGFASSTVIVTSGSSSGCRGVVHNEDIQ